MATKETNTCTACGIEKPLTEFNKDRNQCIPCKLNRFNKRASGSYQAFCRQLLSNAKHAHKKRIGAVKDLEFELTPEEVIAKWEIQEGRCALTGLFLTHHRDGSGYKEHNASIDRINPKLGYTVDNIQLVCYRINLMKHALTEDMFYWWIKHIHNFSCD